MKIKDPFVFDVFESTLEILVNYYIIFVYHILKDIFKKRLKKVMKYNKFC